jgi:hypothetical protein
MYNFVGTHGTSGTHWCIPYSYQRVKCVPQLLFSWHTLAVSGTHSMNSKRKALASVRLWQARWQARWQA